MFFLSSLGVLFKFYWVFLSVFVQCKVLRVLYIVKRSIRNVNNNNNNIDIKIYLYCTCTFWCSIRSQHLAIRNQYSAPIRNALYRYTYT